MRNTNLSINNYIQDKYLKKKSLRELSKKFEKKFRELNNEIISINKTLHVLNKKFRFNFDISNLKKFKKFKTIVMIGMGGSILGAEAVSNFLKKKITKKVYFLNDIEPKKIFDLKKKININKTLFLVISKSGNTVETISNLLILNIIKKNSKNIILISEKNNNSIFYLAKKFNLFYIEHKSFIGGRFSVLAEVGIIPAYLMGIDIKKLRFEVSKYLKNKNKILLKNSTIMLANLLKIKKINNLIFLNYSSELKKFLFWCQQLIAESLGKNGKGFLPTISKVPKDHHSLLQLYLDGPRDKIFYIFDIEDRTSQRINTKNFLGKNFFLNKNTLSEVKNAQKTALIKTLKQNKIPFREFTIKKINEEVLGELFSYFMLETVVVGKLLNINPFDQPAVEQVKIYTKKLLR